MSAETPFSWAVGGNAHTQRWDGGPFLMQQPGLFGSQGVRVCACACACVWPACGIPESRIGETLEALVFSPVSNRRELLRGPRLTIRNWALPGVDAQGRCSFRQSRRMAGTGQGWASANFDVRWREEASRWILRRSRSSNGKRLLRPVRTTWAVLDRLRSSIGILTVCSLTTKEARHVSAPASIQLRSMSSFAQMRRGYAPSHAHAHT